MFQAVSGQRARLSCLPPPCTEGRQVGALNASSTLWHPQPITAHPSQLSLPFSHRLSGSDGEDAAAATLKDARPQRLTSFPDRLLRLARKSLLIVVHLKKRGFQPDARPGWIRTASGKELLRGRTCECRRLYKVSINTGKESSWKQSCNIHAHKLMKAQISLHIYTGATRRHPTL